MRKERKQLLVKLLKQYKSQNLKQGFTTNMDYNQVKNQNSRIKKKLEKIEGLLSFAQDTQFDKIDKVLMSNLKECADEFKELEDTIKGIIKRAKARP